MLATITRQPDTPSKLVDTSSEFDDLIRISRESARGLLAVSDWVDDAELSMLFRQMGIERERLCEGLTALVWIDSRGPREAWRSAPRVHRWWEGLDRRVGSLDRAGILAEAQRGEHQVMGAVKAALDETEGSPIQGEIERLYDMIRAGHALIRQLRHRDTRWPCDRTGGRAVFF